MTDRDEMWVDLTQFDTHVADSVWDGTHRDPDAPAWYRDLRSLIHRARGPAEPHELLDEPELVATMHRATLGGTLARLPRSSGARTLGRVLAMKAAAATTASMISVAAAAAATTGIVATVAATVVVPVVKDHVVPMLNDHLTPTVAAPAQDPANTNVAGTVSHHTEAELALAAPARRRSGHGAGRHRRLPDAAGRARSGGGVRADPGRRPGPGGRGRDPRRAPARRWTRRPSTPHRSTPAPTDPGHAPTDPAPTDPGHGNPPTDRGHGNPPTDPGRGSSPAAPGHQ